MKIEAFKEYIKKTVQQEVRSVLKEELKQQLAEILLGNNTKKRQSSDSDQKLSSLMSEETVVSDDVVKQKTKKQVKYTNNLVLNEILNQTTGGVPREGEMVGLIGDGFGGSTAREQINEVKAPENAPEPVKNVYNAMTRDYRSLMKAVDKKRNKN